MFVEVSVDDGMLSWRYVVHGDEFEQTVPLSKMLPHPMFSVERGRRWKYLAMILLLPSLAFGVARWIELGWIQTVMAPLLIFAVLFYRFAPWLADPIEWATFDTMLKDKTVYVFRGAKAAEFDEFVAALDGAIRTANKIPVQAAAAAGAPKSPNLGE
ncbi:MAG: hypothetical protein AAF989_06070 [Planctomycetota bacterium]